MPLTFENFKGSYLKKGKPVYVPNDFSLDLGKKLLRKVSRRYKFDPFFYHFKDGSHVVALHKHRENKFFCRVDIQRFFYSIKRNRIKRHLKAIGVPKPEYHAKWSTVKNPYPGGGYVLPYGFRQSPILASLILSESPVGIYLRGLPASITKSVFMDDICLSGMDKDELQTAFDGLRQALRDAGFDESEGKTEPPTEQITLFNCTLENDSTEVMPERIDEFFDQEDLTDAMIAGFETYCDIVQSKTWRAGVGKRRRRLKYEARQKASRHKPT